MSRLRSCLPEKMPEDCMFDRTQEIKQVKDFLQSGTVAVVLITGEPGIGKTTVAKEVAHERTILFCPLRTKRNVSEVAIEMIDSCDRIHTQQPRSQGLSSYRLGRARRDPGLVWSRATVTIENIREGSSVIRQFVALRFVALSRHRHRTRC